MYFFHVFIRKFIKTIVHETIGKIHGKFKDVTSNKTSRPMLSVTQQSIHASCALSYDDVPQHPLERIYPLRVDIELRRSTFSSWPKKNMISPDKLCDNGFYYMGTQDKVQCTFCGGWVADDDIAREHARHFAQCELVRIKQNYGSRNFEFSSLSLKKPVEDNTTSSESVKPHNKKYCLNSDRLSSYRKWPKHINQKPEDLAATGLYYKGNGDECQCYMCGGILSGWETGDIPKEEHKNWFPKCQLVN